MKKLYMIAQYFQVPKNPRRTFTKEYGKDPNNLAFNESVIISRSVKNRDLSSANVILNITDKKVVKCNLRRDASYDDLYRYYKNNYPQYFQHLDVVEVTAEDTAESTVTQPTSEPVINS